MASCLSKPVFCASFAEKELEETTTDIPLTAHSSLQLALVEMEMGNQSLASGKTIMPIEMVSSGKPVFLASIIKRDSVTAASDSIPEKSANAATASAYWLSAKFPAYMLEKSLS